MANNSNLSRRAALKRQQELEARRKRNTRMLGIGLGVLSLVVVAVIVIVVANAMNSKTPAAEQLTPPNATAEYGISIKSKNTQPAGDVPHVVVYEDYQCPACKGYETQYGSAFLQLIDEGKITLEIRTAYFLDNHLPQSNKSSERAALAAAAADAVGKYREYHQVVYENQPQEGVGYTDQQLRVDFAAKAGITGADLTAFQKEYDDKAYADFAKKSFQSMADNKVESTPTYRVNGKDLKLNGSQADPQSLLVAIQAVAGNSSAVTGSN